MFESEVLCCYRNLRNVTYVHNHQERNQFRLASLLNIIQFHKFRLMYKIGVSQSLMKIEGYYMYNMWPSIRKPGLCNLYTKYTYSYYSTYVSSLLFTILKMCKLHEILYEMLNKWIRLLHIINILYDFETYVFKLTKF